MPGSMINVLDNNVLVARVLNNILATRVHNANLGRIQHIPIILPANNPHMN